MIEQAGFDRMDAKTVGGILAERETAELFGYADGISWGVGDYLLKPSSRVAVTPAARL
jgi:hypothetical protein